MCFLLLMFHILHSTKPLTSITVDFSSIANLSIKCYKQFVLKMDKNLSLKETNISKV